jgi:hypothetical protein
LAPALAQEYQNILQDFAFHFHLKLFSGVLSKAEKLFKIMQSKSYNITYCSKKKVEEFKNLLTGKLRNFGKFDQKMRDAHRKIQTA